MISKNSLLRNISNVFGWRSKRRIVVFESDDWGSIRMPSVSVYERLRDRLQLESGHDKTFNQFDTLATRADLSALYETLSMFKDGRGNPPVFTAISVVANPDFDKIKKSNFQLYCYEPFTATLERYGRDGAFDMWLEGISSKLFKPQFHGREHLNVAVWMKDLQENNPQTHLAFNNGMWGFKNQNQFGIKYQAAFDLGKEEEIDGQHEIVIQGLDLFESLFGYRASFFVPPNGPINNLLHRTTSQFGIKYLSAPKIQYEPLGRGRTRRVFHYLGQQSREGQICITRNCFFEPAHPGRDWVQSCISEISNAFTWKKPAVISSHRVNYIGANHEYNRQNGLNKLALLLREITRKWPDIEFMTSDALGDLISHSKDT